jgi:hypothetical protein
MIYFTRSKWNDSIHSGGNMGKNDTNMNPVVEYFRFGSIAYQRRYLTKEQIQEALSEQVEDNLSGRPHRLLGTIFREKGWLTEEQEKSILADMGMDKK